MTAIYPHFPQRFLVNRFMSCVERIFYFRKDYGAVFPHLPFLPSTVLQGAFLEFRYLRRIKRGLSGGQVNPRWCGRAMTLPSESESEASRDCGDLKTWPPTMRLCVSSFLFSTSPKIGPQISTNDTFVTLEKSQEIPLERH